MSVLNAFAVNAFAFAIAWLPGQALAGSSVATAMAQSSPSRLTIAAHPFARRRDRRLRRLGRRFSHCLGRRRTADAAAAGVPSRGPHSVPRLTRPASRVGLLSAAAIDFLRMLRTPSEPRPRAGTIEMPCLHRSCLRSAQALQVRDERAQVRAA